MEIGPAHSIDEISQSFSYEYDLKKMGEMDQAKSDKAITGTISKVSFCSAYVATIGLVGSVFVPAATLVVGPPLLIAGLGALAIAGVSKLANNFFESKRMKAEASFYNAGERKEFVAGELNKMADAHADRVSKGLPTIPDQQAVSEWRTNRNKSKLSMG